MDNITTNQSSIVPSGFKTYVVTGATSGIGLAVAEQLARQGAYVIGVGRSAERCRAAEQLLSRAYPQSLVAYLTADLSLQSEVRRLAACITEIAAQQGGSLDGLVNNAGTFTYWFTQTAEGFEMQWAVNHLAPFLLTNLLMPLLNQTAEPRVVTVSSGSHYGARMNWDDLQLRRRYNGLRAYGQSKQANVLFSLELNRRQPKLRAFAADPGLVKTEIGFKGTPSLVRWIWQRRRAAGIAPEEAAAGIVYLVSDPEVQSSTEVYWKHSRPKAADRAALDGESAARLWNLSAQMCGL